MSLRLSLVGFVGLIRAVEWCVVVLSAVMDNQSTFCKEEAIRLDLPWCSDDFRHLFLCKLRHIIAEFPFVCAVWNDEAESEAVVLNHAPPKVVPFDHFQILNGLGADAEGHRQSDGLQAEEVRSEVVLYQAFGGVVGVAQVRLTFDLFDGHVNQCDV